MHSTFDPVMNKMSHQGWERFSTLTGGYDCANRRYPQVTQLLLRRRLYGASEDHQSLVAQQVQGRTLGNGDRQGHARPLEGVLDGAGRPAPLRRVAAESINRNASINAGTQLAWSTECVRLRARGAR